MIVEITVILASFPGHTELSVACAWEEPGNKAAVIPNRLRNVLKGSG